MLKRHRMMNRGAEYAAIGIRVHCFNARAGPEPENSRIPAGVLVTADKQHPADRGLSIDIPQDDILQDAPVIRRHTVLGGGTQKQPNQWPGQPRHHPTWSIVQITGAMMWPRRACL